jgi:hypothetical protein
MTSLQSRFMRSLDPQQKQCVARRTQFQEMNKKSALHVAQGQAYAWTRDIDAERQAVFTGIHRALLELLGYPLEASQAAAPLLPALPSGSRLQHFLGEHVSEFHQQTRTEHS